MNEDWDARVIDKRRLSDLSRRELENYRCRNPGSAERLAGAREQLLGGVPMNWMLRLIVMHDLPWHVTQLGARAEYHLKRVRPRNGADLAAAADESIARYLRLYLMNRGILTTPFHNMALMAPTTCKKDVAHHEHVLGEGLRELVGQEG